MAFFGFSNFLFCFAVLVGVFVFVFSPSNAQLTADYYSSVCPGALSTIRSVVKRAIIREPRMGASLLRLHFHDCFVNGCDGSILLDDTDSFTGEKNALPNKNSVRGFDVIDQIKTKVNKVCKANDVVSCADILAVAARDSVAILGGPNYKVLLGRRDALTANQTDANNNLPPPFLSFSQLLSNFQAHGLDIKDLILLSAGHTLGFSHCSSFKNRIYNDTNIDSNFAESLKTKCPQIGGDRNLQSFDKTPFAFDTSYYKALITKKGLLHSDQELFKGDGSETDNLVSFYSKYPLSFFNDFGYSMIKMGNMKLLTGTNGEIRKNCRVVN